MIIRKIPLVNMCNIPVMVDVLLKCNQETSCFDATEKPCRGSGSGRPGRGEMVKLRPCIVDGKEDMSKGRVR